MAQVLTSDTPLFSTLFLESPAGHHIRSYSPNHHKDLTVRDVPDAPQILEGTVVNRPPGPSPASMPKRSKLAGKQ